VAETNETALLVHRAQLGDPEAFASLARAFLRPACSLAIAIVGGVEDAEDVAQDAFVIALQKIRTCRDPARFGAWLLQIVRNQALNWVARRRVRDGSRNAFDARAAVAPIRPEHVGLRDRLITALACLSPTQREVVLLHDLADWTHAEIAAALEISEVMSRQHLFQARRQLRAELQADAVAEG